MTAISPGDRAQLWRAVYHLREAETLASIATVAGPADAPPSAVEEAEAWALDLASRGKAALQKAHQDAVSATGRYASAARDKAASVAAHLWAAAKRAMRGSLGFKAGTKAGDALRDLSRISREMTIGWGIGSAVLTGFLLWGAWKLWSKRSK